MDKIICVGKNYLEHAKELGDAVPDKPVLFLKPPSVLITVDSESQIRLPSGRGSIHPELEIVARLAADCSIDAVTLGLDMTLRDVQAGLKKQGHPWEVSKVFAGSAIIGAWIPLQEFSGYLDAAFSLTVDGVLRQKGIGSEMRMSPDDCALYAGEYFPIRAGDALFTGTPAGVGPIAPGQVAELAWGERLRYRVRFL